MEVFAFHLSIAFLEHLRHCALTFNPILQHHRFRRRMLAFKLLARRVNIVWLLEPFLYYLSRVTLIIKNAFVPKVLIAPEKVNQLTLRETVLGPKIAILALPS